MSGRVGTLIWCMASLATAGCFLVGNYEVSESVESKPPSTEDDGETSTAVAPEVNPNLVAPNDADASVSTNEPATGETTTGDTAVDSVTTAISVSSNAPTSTGETTTSTGPETTSAAESSPTTSESLEESTTPSDAGASVSTAPESTAPPQCPADTMYNETFERCVFDCDNGVRGPEGRCYWIGDPGDEMPWEGVPELCSERGTGWNTLSIRSLEEHTFITGILEQDTWLGARDTTPDQWLWEDDGTPFWEGQEDGHVIDGAFEAWGNQEPSAANDEQCARYHGSNDGNNWTWSDCSCGPQDGSWGGGGRGGGGGEDEADVYLPACKGPATLAPE